MPLVLVDTGPLIAVLSPTDAHHRECVEQLHKLAPPLPTCWPVVTEAAWLLRREPAAIQRLLGSFDAGLLRLLVMNEAALPWIAAFLQRYRRLGPQLADAALVYLAEREDIDTVFTLDRRDFSVYRFGRNRSFHLLPEP